ncbi:hypothetical protein [Nocardiopsis sp. FR26]|uniref:hypothetical protein n=1 Tax=Nocardiopsis sp. FR26 TaxID=2605987 RepID=UPI00135A2082|nr:hypothetical protein [Nocardiopsis sp. FR26]
MTSPDLPTWLTSAGVWIGGVAALITGITVITVGARKAAVNLVRFVRRTVHLVDDLVGEPERPGVEGRPGVMERLAQIEDRLSDVEHEVKHNNGTSLKDSAKRTEDTVKELADRVDKLAARDPHPPVVQQDITIRPDQPD